MKSLTQSICAVIALSAPFASFSQSTMLYRVPGQAVIAVDAATGTLPIAPAHTLAKISAAVAPTVPLASPFDVTTSDQTMRDVLVRWATSAGWVHSPEHWTIDRDLPISGTADSSVFGMDFKDATRKLLASSDLTDRPVQPCFYSNRVVRVVPKAEICDRAKQ
jgi:hypothetical protein